MNCPNTEPKVRSPLDAYKQRQLSWSSHKCLPVGLQGSTLRLHHCDERLYLCGGALEDASPNKAVYSSLVHCVEQWERVGADPPPLYHCASAAIHNELVLIGGLDSATDRCTRDLSSYDRRSGRWVRRLPPMPTPRSSAAAFVTGDYVMVVGGQGKGGRLVNAVEVLHIPSSRWEVAAPLPESMAGQSGGVCGDRICLMAGIDETGEATTTIYVASIPQILSTCRFFSLLENTTNTSCCGAWRRLSDCLYQPKGVIKAFTTTAL